MKKLLNASSCVDILKSLFYTKIYIYEFYILKLYLIWREEMFEADFRFEFFSLKYFLCKNNFVWAFFKESHSIAPPPFLWKIPTP